MGQSIDDYEHMYKLDHIRYARSICTRTHKKPTIVLIVAGKMVEMV